MPSQRNILLILCDQLRADFLSVYGGPDLTPNIDRLAREGVVFDRAYCTMPLCITSRMTLLTGMHPASCPARIPPEAPTIPGLLADAGWHTCAMGKMHMKPAQGPYGFQQLRLAEDTEEGMFLDEYHPWLAREGYYEWSHGLDNWDILSVESHLPEEKSVTRWNGDRAVEYLHARAGATQPFYGVVSFVKPHPPYDPPLPWARLVDPARTPAPLGLSRAAEDYPEVVRLFREVFGDAEVERLGMTQRIRAHYLGLVAQIDHEIGRILDTLEAEGLAEDTLVIFSADHGDMLGDHRQYMKFFAYEASAHIPLILRGPGIAPGRSAIPVSNLDLAPTMLAYCGRPVPPTCQGENLCTLLETGGDGREGVLVSLCLGPGYCWATEHAKYTIYPNGEEEFIDLRTDPEETVNLAAENPPGLAASRQALAAELGRLHRERLPGMPPLVDEQGTPLGGDGAYRTIEWMKQRYIQHRTPPQYTSPRPEGSARR